MKLLQPVVCSLPIALGIACAPSEMVDATQVIVVVSSDLEIGPELTSIQVTVEAADGNRVGARAFPFVLAKTTQTKVGTFALPLSFGITKRPNGADTFRVVVEGFGPNSAGADHKVIEQMAIATFQERRTLRLTAFLGSRCLQKSCDPADRDLVCYAAPHGSILAGQCGPVQTAELEPITPKEELNGIAGSTAAQGTGTAVPSDPDAGRRGDAGVLPPTSASDAGVRPPSGGSVDLGAPSNREGDAAATSPAVVEDAGNGSAPSAAPSDDGAGSTDAHVTTVASAARDAGIVQPNASDTGGTAPPEIVTIGDSLMSNTLQIEGTGGGIAPALMMATGHTYPNYAIQGVRLLADDTFGAAIPSQWAEAAKANPEIKTVIMTAGGSDINQDNTIAAACKNGDAACMTQLNTIADGLAALWAKMAVGGVADIIYIEYPASSGLLKNYDAYSALMAARCAAVPMPTRCHVLGTDGLAAQDLAADGIHPTAAANGVIAAALVKLLDDQHIPR